MANQSQTSKRNGDPCPEGRCDGSGFIYHERNKASECDCRIKALNQRRFSKAMIPQEYEDSKLDNFNQYNDTTERMYKMAIAYLKDFASIRETKRNSIGIMAEYGEAAIKSAPLSQRRELKQKYNSYGLGKTHLETAMAKWIMHKIEVTDKNGDGVEYQRPIRVYYISDKDFMDEVMDAKRSDDTSDIQKILKPVYDADVLLWDDLGKSNWSEAKEKMYYAIINHFYKHRKPIIWSSNEDEHTLGEKIGYDAADRVLGMSMNYLIAVSGQSYRLKDNA